MPENTEHPFAQYVRILAKGPKTTRSLTQQEAYDAFSMILNNAVEDIQLGAFLTLLRVKEESPEEIAGFAQACKDFIAVPDDIKVDIDWASYAGKRKQLPWFIAVLLLLAGKGYRVFIHGATGHTAGRLYTEQAFTFLGLPVAKNWEQVRNNLDQYNLCYMPVDALCPPLSQCIAQRNLLGVRSTANTLSRLINPFNADYCYSSIFHPAYAAKHQQAAQLLGQQNMSVFKGESGEIERKPDATCLVKAITQGEIVEEKWPRLQANRQEPEPILNLDLIKKVWRGELHHPYGEQAVTGTLAILLKQLKPVSSMDEASTMATVWWQERDRQIL